MSLMAEADALKKWCPHARSANADDVAPTSVNRAYRNGAPDCDCMCLASACMAWRWTRDDLIETVGVGTSALAVIREGAGPYSTTHGYCGLAGKP